MLFLYRLCYNQFMQSPTNFPPSSPRPIFSPKNSPNSNLPYIPPPVLSALPSQKKSPKKLIFLLIFLFVLIIGGFITFFVVIPYINQHTFRQSLSKNLNDIVELETIAQTSVAHGYSVQDFFTPTMHDQLNTLIPKLDTIATEFSALHPPRHANFSNFLEYFTTTKENYHQSLALYNNLFSALQTFTPTSNPLPDHESLTELFNQVNSFIKAQQSISQSIKDQHCLSKPSTPLSQACRTLAFAKANNDFFLVSKEPASLLFYDFFPDILDASTTLSHQLRILLEKKP